MKPVKACLWRDSFFVWWCPPQGLCKAPHDSGVCWKQFMMMLQEEVLVCGGVSFHPPLHVPGRRSHSRPCGGSAQCQGCQCTTALSPQLLMVLKNARRLAISAALSGSRNG